MRGEELDQDRQAGLHPVEISLVPVRLAAALLLALLCSQAWADSAWKPAVDTFRKMFPGKPPPVEVAPLPPLPEPDAAAAIERALLDAELQAAVRKAQEAAERAEEAAKAVPVPLPPPKPRAKTTRQPLSLAPPPRRPTSPEENDGWWLPPCFMVCGHLSGKTKAELDADEAYWRVSARQKAHGQRCVVNTCPDSVPPEVLKEMKQKIRG